MLKYLVIRNIMPELLNCFPFFESICKGFIISHVQQNPQNLQNTTVSICNSPESLTRPYRKTFLSQSFCSGIWKYKAEYCSLY